MISVCIPVYNKDVKELTGQLFHQLLKSGKPSEIILIDDASSMEFRRLNRLIPPEQARLIELNKNVGRARIRNLFLEYAGQPFLLFLDCDTAIPSGSFISNYLEAIGRHPDRLICGGIVYHPHRPGRNWLLHWKYGRKRESQPANVRNRDPNRSFMTSNFLVPAKILEKLHFDERLRGYGHEDSLYGYQLGKMHQSIVHIDNPVLHEGLKDNREFLKKTDESLQNLFRITGFSGVDPEFRPTIRLLKHANRLDKTGITRLFCLLFRIFGKPSRYLLSLGYAIMPLLSFYKLGTYLRIRSRGIM